jgi:SAM-dependent methyltransferase
MEERKKIFDTVAEQYEQFRPGYPDELFSELISLSGLPEKGRILEIACGTGQATLPMARRGYSIVCVELGDKLANIARKKLAEFSEVSIHTKAFEDFELPSALFDLVMVGTAFHWFNSAENIKKIAASLRSGGAFAYFDNFHGLFEKESFFGRAQEFYQKYMPESAKSWQTPKETKNIVPSSLDVEFFEPTMAKAFSWTHVYNTKDYIGLLDTYSDHRSLPLSDREALYQSLTELSEAEFGGKIEKHYVAALNVARRK